MQPSTSFGNKAPRLVSRTHYCVMGDVTVADDVAIAPGVVLQASPGSRIVIASGACLAGGVCLQSRQGVLTIGAGANLGANVLVVGYGSIGDRACISPGSTLMNPQIEAEGLVPPGSLVVVKAANPTVSASGSTYTPPHSPSGSGSGNGSSGGHRSGISNLSDAAASTPAKFSYGRPLASPMTGQATAYPQVDSVVNTFVEPPPVGPKAISVPSLHDQDGKYVDPSAQNNGVQSNSGYNGASTSASQSTNGLTGTSGANSSALSVPNTHRVYGKDQVSQLLSTLFPHR